VGRGRGDSKTSRQRSTIVSKQATSAAMPGGEPRRLLEKDQAGAGCMSHPDVSRSLEEEQGPRCIGNSAGKRSEDPAQGPAAPRKTEQ